MVVTAPLLRPTSISPGTALCTTARCGGHARARPGGLLYPAQLVISLGAVPSGPPKGVKHKCSQEATAPSAYRVSISNSPLGPFGCKALKVSSSTSSDYLAQGTGLL